MERVDREPASALELTSGFPRSGRNDIKPRDRLRAALGIGRFALANAHAAVLTTDADFTTRVIPNEVLKN